MQSVPTVLLVQLKRFLFSADGGARKLTIPIVIPPTVRVKTIDPNSDNETLWEYRLTATIHHEGSLPTCGHYTAAVRDGASWTLCNDDTTSETTLHDLNCRTVYVLFYLREGIVQPQ